MDVSSHGKGFLLTRNSRDQLNTTELEYWVHTDSGPALLRVTGQKPIFFIESGELETATAALKQAGIAAEVKALELKTFEGQSVAGVYNRTIHLHYRSQDILRNHGLDLYETDVRLHERFLMERFICGSVEFAGDPITRDAYIEYRNARIKPADYDPALKTLSLDIECDMTSELFSVGLSGCGTAEVLMIGEPEAGPENGPENGSEKEHETAILWCADEAALLRLLTRRILELDPDAIIGWNLVNFDLRILLQRSEHHNIKFAIGRGGQLPGWRDQRGEKDKGFISIPGRVAIDGIDALKTATYRFASFSLENVSRELLGKGKLVEHDVDDRLAEIRHNFLHDKPRLAAYNLEDCRLVEEIFEHTRILDFLALRSQITGLEIDRAGGSVAAFYNLYMPRLHRGGYVAPNLPPDGGLASPGGYVMDSRPGLYRNVLVLDFKSLYPSIIRTFKIDPMGLVEGLESPEDAVEGFRGGKFHREKHFLPEIITGLWQQRDIAKKNNDAPRSQAIKILMNSFYGVLGAGGCRFYDPRLASSITMRGHEIMQTTGKWIEEMGYQVIYGDTDSLFIWIEGDQSPNICREIGSKLESTINHRWHQKLQTEFGLDCFLELEFETHYSRFLMPTIRGSDAGTKKRYAGMIQGDGGDQLVFKGLETVRTDWTLLAREFQTTLYDMVFHDQDPTEFIRGITLQTLAGAHDQKLVYRKQLRRQLNQYVKNVPPHVRAARLADEENARQGKNQRYQHKGWISYVLTVNGPEPVEYLNSPIDYQQYVDKQLKPVADGILPFIDLDFDAIVSAQAAIF